MRWIAFTAALTGFLLLSFAGSTSAADTTAACPLLTQAQIAAVFGGPVGAGAPIIVATSCQWVGQQGKRVTLTLNQPRGGKSPVDQYNDGKARGLPGVMVKKGSSVFEIRLYGFDLSQAKTVSKTLAQDVAGKF
jgi:hypothetical protein